MKLDFLQVECIYCGQVDGWPCVSRSTGGNTGLFHIQRKLLWVLRQENPWDQLLGPLEPGYLEETTRLRAKLIELQRDERPREHSVSLPVDPDTTEPPLIDRTLRDLRIKVSDLTRLLDRAHELIRNAEQGVREGMPGEKNVELWLQYMNAFNMAYDKMKEK